MTESQPSFDYEARTRSCQEVLADRDVECVVLSPGPNMTYLSGFVDEPMERHLLLFVPRSGEPIFLAPTMYDEQLRADSWVTRRRLWDDGDDPTDALTKIVADLDLVGGRVLVDDRMWALFTQDLRDALPDATFGLASEVLTELRLTKNEVELEAMARAATVADDVSVEIRELGASAVGMTEAELAREIETRLADYGGDGPSFETIVGAGPNGAKPHHRHGAREIRAADPVVLDFGTRVDGYPSDQTRTVVFGDAGSTTAGDSAGPETVPDEFSRVFETVREAQEAAVATVEPGIAAEAVDRAARDVIEAAGYGEQFVHRTGHGVGLEVHEPPYIVAGNERTLEPGMVFSIEPGIYVQDSFGVRIEDLVAVTENGCRRLNDSPRGYTMR
ncbi:peptidase M24 [Halovivax asiaticus JCM 14624]|uniref:Peptidase M24 n=1 Tax=Halovivax asiaticus JCM 14624 TaxID=1227490 RepID=M0BRY6_9EURY|nr:Xaa-Pro peptidase family protein [Halovivax asiaticus]ELZ13700.1 peptidase M24 [Halovivax asiaticus JCM 14624]